MDIDGHIYLDENFKEIEPHFDTKMEDEHICEKCSHKKVCYMFKNIERGKNWYSDYFGGETICSDFIRDTIVESNIYDKEETYYDCTVQVLKNSITGETSVGWFRNDEPPVLIGDD